jgi:sterol desaturase/sphingolipid hydroxylase (fatty acid hydroxylase superfamily)
MTILLAGTFAFAFLFAVFRPLELAFPARPDQRFFRPAWITDLSFFLGHYLFWSAIVLCLLAHMRSLVVWMVPMHFRHSVAAQPWWLQAVEVVLLSDFFMYWGHRLQHRVGFLWRFHAVHHSMEHLDWLAAHREHPLDSIYTMTLINLPPMILGFPLETLTGFLVFRGVWAVYLHANVRLPIGPLRWLLGAPELHHWHHARERDAGNYANIAPIMDILFGTYRCPDHEPEHIGIRQRSAGSYLGLLIEPCLLRRLENPNVANGPHIRENESVMRPAGTDGRQLFRESHPMSATLPDPSA